MNWADSIFFSPRELGEEDILETYKAKHVQAFIEEVPKINPRNFDDGSNAEEGFLSMRRSFESETSLRTARRLADDNVIQSLCCDSEGFYMGVSVEKSESGRSKVTIWYYQYFGIETRDNSVDDFRGFARGISREFDAIEAAWRKIEKEVP